MRNISKRDTSIKIMGEKISMPIGIAPTSLQRMAHPDGEIATAKAAQEKGVLYIASTASSIPLEEIADAAPYVVKWMQIEMLTNIEVTKALIKRAEKAGYTALVLTIDCPTFGLRLSDKRNNFMIPPDVKLANLKQEYVDEILGSDSYISKSFHAAPTWEDLMWLSNFTKLPILVKGVLTAEDAVKAVSMGVAGIIVSNHGARQLDGVPATIEVLPEIVKAVGSKTDVFVDGGFREGTDVFKALALGAKMVFVGRPVLWSLCYDGQKGVKLLLDILENEFDNTMAMMGCASMSDITRDMVVHKSYYRRFLDEY